MVVEFFTLVTFGWMLAQYFTLEKFWHILVFHISTILWQMVVFHINKILVNGSISQ